MRSSEGKAGVKTFRIPQLPFLPLLSHYSHNFCSFCSDFLYFHFTLTFIPRLDSARAPCPCSPMVKPLGRHMQ